MSLISINWIKFQPLAVLENEQTDTYTDSRRNVEKNSKSTETLKEFTGNVN